MLRRAVAGYEQTLTEVNQKVDAVQNSPTFPERSPVLV
jgi:hypothetical protein